MVETDRRALALVAVAMLAALASIGLAIAAFVQNLPDHVASLHPALFLAMTGTAAAAWACLVNWWFPL